MKRNRSISLYVLLVFVFGAVLFHAPMIRAAVPQADVFLGMSRLGQNTFYSDAGSQWGWTGAFNVRVKHVVGLEADVAQYGWGTDTYKPHSTTILAGPRLTVGALGVHVFVHALGGIEHVSNSTSTEKGSAMAYGGGGGLDLPISPFFSWRVMADYLNAPSLDPIGSAHSRVSTGIVFRF